MFRSVAMLSSHQLYPIKVIENANIDVTTADHRLGLERMAGARHNLQLAITTAHAGGGPRGIQRHTVRNKKLLPRVRLNMIRDPDSLFLELGVLVGLGMDYGHVPAGGLVSYISQVHGHYCLMSCSEATFKGGTLFPISVEKQIRLQQLVHLNLLPGIYLVDSGGAFLPLQAEIFPDRNHGGRMFRNEAILSAKGVPQIAVVCGSSTAGGAYAPAMAEEASIVHRLGTIFLGGPPLVRAATGEVVTEEELGGADLHCRVSGVTDFFAETEEEAFQQCRENMYMLGPPQPRNLYPPTQPVYNNPEQLSALAGKLTISKSDMLAILAHILDGSMFKEFKGKYGHNLLAGFGFLKGQAVGVLANAGPLSKEDAEKGAHHILLCERRGIPLLFLQNSTGQPLTLPDDQGCPGELIKARSKMIAAHSCFPLPKVSLNVGGCFGDDNFTMVTVLSLFTLDFVKLTFDKAQFGL
ncbi:hypothetical protein LAZ67_3000113 [Cordylochernes scorpioides]|uniref:methylcrotonoyl-CoA carboxylase n=1 Tax=Cordylochernes scorpioides TaxID=51811 RepID=A0ABY6K6Q9_9ARAC|nr:hypothetical protein LAZ67_3000113 [Cordylochernes scorpioides]